MSFVDSFRTSSPTRQIVMVGLAAAAIGAVLIAAYLLVLRKPYAVLFGDLRAPDAAAVVAELDKKKIPYRIEDGGATIRVPSNLVDTARVSLAGEDLPLKGAVGFELFNKSDMGLTEFAQRINYQRALQGELARTIMTMDSVESARVHLMLAEPTVFRGDRQPSKAAVTVQARAGKTITGDTAQGIQRLVAAAVPDLAASDVVVLDATGEVLGGTSAAPVPPPPGGQERQAIEQYYAARVRQALAKLAVGDADVQVTARSGAPSASADDDSALRSWTPDARAFPLTVAIAFPALPNPEVEDQIRRAASEAIGLNGAKGDTLMLALAPGSAPGAVAGDPRSPIAAAPAPALTKAQVWGGPSPASRSGLAILLPALALLLGLAVLLWRRSLGPRRLTHAQRVAMAERLRRLLDTGEAHAIPPG
jgi:flagellar M-ring protein FliF